MDKIIKLNPRCKFILLYNIEETFKLSAKDTAKQPTNNPAKSPKRDRKIGPSQYEKGDMK